MNNFIPAFYYPTKTICIDDSKIILKGLSILFEGYNVDYYSCANKCINKIHSYTPAIDAKKFLKNITESLEYDTSQKSPVELDITDILEISKNEKKYNEVSTAVIDYDMPEMSGYDLAEKLPRNLKKILLTGHSANKTIVDGFNSATIDKYVQKSVEETEEELLSYIDELKENYFREKTAPIVSFLFNKDGLLYQPEFIKVFKKVLKEKNISEYYLANKEGSFLFLDAEKKQHILAVMSEGSLERLISDYPIKDSLEESSYANLKNYTHIPFFGLNKEPWDIELIDWSNNIFPAMKINTDTGNYYYSLISEQ